MFGGEPSPPPPPVNRSIHRMHAPNILPTTCMWVHTHACTVTHSCGGVTHPPFATFIRLPTSSDVYCWPHELRPYEVLPGFDPVRGGGGTTNIKAPLPPNQTDALNRLSTVGSEATRWPLRALRIKLKM